MSLVADNIISIQKRVASAVARTGRSQESVKLVAVSKQVPTSLIKEAFEAGQKIFGENYAQDLRDKSRELADLPIEWHFIGHMQKNKVKYVAPVATMVESIDSFEIADAISAKATRVIPCLIEVNLGDESSKAGTSCEAVFELATQIIKLPNLKLVGLMALPPYFDDAEKSRPYFKTLSLLMKEMNEKLSLNSPLTELSMGMSHDFEVAIEEGATIVRVGTAIFGGRQ